MNLKHFVTIIISLFVIAGAVFCITVLLSNGSIQGSSENKANTDKSTASIEPWKEAYKELLEENKSLIEAYDWQQNEDYSVPDRQIYVFDINGDNIPELFFFAAGKVGENRGALLNIHTFSNGQAKKMEYECEAIGGEKLLDGFYDEEAGAGVWYAVTSAKDHNGFILYYAFGYDVGGEDSCYVFEMPNDTLKEELHFRHDEFPLDFSSGGTEPAYSINGEIVFEDEYNSRIEEIIEKSDEVLLCSYQFTEGTLWERLDVDNTKSMTYEEAISTLSK